MVKDYIEVFDEVTIYEWFGLIEILGKRHIDFISEIFLSTDKNGLQPIDVTEYPQM